MEKIILKILTTEVDSRSNTHMVSTVKVSRHLSMAEGFTGQFVTYVLDPTPIKSGSHVIAEQ